MIALFALLRRLAAVLRKLFLPSSRPVNSDVDTRRAERLLSAESLEPRILYSAAPAPAAEPADAPVEAAPAEAPPAAEAAPVAEAAPAAEVAPAATAPAEGETAQAAPPASGETDISADQGVELVDGDALDTSLNQQTLEAVADAAKQRWVESGISAEQIEALDSITYTIADLDVNQLGQVNGAIVTIDDDAAETGAWFIDATPGDDEEFLPLAGSPALAAAPDLGAAGAVDLLTVILHEQGHVMGLSDDGERSAGLMHDWLSAGTRILPLPGEADGSVPGKIAEVSFVKLNDPLVTDGDVHLTPLQVSADSNWVVWMADADTDGSLELFSRRIDGSGPEIQINAPFATGANGALTGFQVSADSNRVVWVANAEATNTMEIYSRAIDGSGAQVKLNSAIVPSSPGFHGVGYFEISPDSNRVVWSADADTDDTVELFSRAIDGTGVQVKLNDPLVAGGDLLSAGFQISADSNHVVWVADADTDGVEEIYSRQINGGGVEVKLNTPLVAGGSVDPDFQISLDSTRVVWRADGTTDEVFELYSRTIDGSGGQVTINDPLVAGGDVDGGFLIGADLHGNFEITPDSSRVLWRADADTNGIINLYSRAIDGTGVEVQVNDPLVGGGFLFDFEISADSSRVVWRADADTNDVNELYSRATDGSGLEVKLNDAMIAGGDVFQDFRISADSGRVLWWADADLDTVNELYSRAIDGSGSEAKVNNDLALGRDVGRFTISPDSRRAVWTADADADGKSEIFSKALDGTGSQIKVSGAIIADGDVSHFAVSPDSMHVVYRADQDTNEVYEIYSEPLPAVADPEVTDSSPGGAAHDVGADEDISVTFDGGIEGGSQQIIAHAMQQGLLSGTLTRAGSVLTFDPDGEYLPGELVNVTVTDNPTVFQFRSTVTGGVGNFVDSGQRLGTLRSSAVTLGDLNGDGDLDAVIGNTGFEDTSKIWLNNGGGFFTDSGQNLGNTDGAAGVSLGDLDNDGDLDIFFAMGVDAPNEVWLNDGTGIFTDTGQSLGVSHTLDVSLGDVDGDGDLDAFAANTSGQANKVWINDGGGFFSDSGLALGNSSTRAAGLADFDGDGDLDAISVNTAGQADKIWFNDGSGVFTDSGQALGSLSGFGVEVGDLDSDGDFDIFVANAAGGANKVWVNNGSGTFSDSGQALGNHHSYDVSLGDLDNDGDLDAFVTNAQHRNRIWTNDGSGTFSESSQILSDISGQEGDLGDIDGDGDLDVFVVNSIDPNEVWFNQLPADTEVTLDAGGNLVITDIAGGDSDDTLTLSTDGAVLTIADPNHIIGLNGVAGLGNGSHTVTIDLGLAGWTGGIVVDTLDGDDDLTLDFATGNFGRAITYQGGGQLLGDDLALTGGGAFANAIFTYTGPDSGTIDVAGNATLTYTGLEPVSSAISIDALTIDTTAASAGGSGITMTNYTGTFTVTGTTAIGGRAIEPTDFVIPGESLEIIATPADTIDLVAGPGGNFLEIGQMIGHEATYRVEAGLVTVDPALVLNFDLNGLAGAGNPLGHDQVQVNGMIDLGGASLNLLGTHFPIGGDSFVLIDNDGIDPVIGTFNGLAEGATITNFLGSGLDATITYAGGTNNNDVVVTVNTPPVIDVDISIDKDSGAVAVAQGGIVTYTLTVTGDATEAVNGATVTDIFPTAFDVVTLTDVQLNGGATTSFIALPGAPVIGPFFEIVDLPAGSSVVFTFEAQVYQPNAFNRAVDANVTNVATVEVPAGYHDIDETNNHDGDSEVIVLTATGGHGNFIDSGQSLGTSDSFDVKLGDLDNDGDLDAFVANFNLQPSRVWLNDGSGAFSDNGQTWSSSPDPSGIGLGDLDSDGDLDAFLITTSGNQVWLNDGFGNFDDSGQRLGSSISHGINLGDVDSDGDLDAFVANRSDQANTVWLNNGAGVFTDSGQTLGGSSSMSARLGDLDNDGDLDAFVTNSLADKVWLNNGLGLFTDSGQELGNSLSRGVGLGDLDNNGTLDVFIAKEGANEVWLNNGSGIFSNSSQSLGSSISSGVSLGDLDNDGDLDAFVAKLSGTERGNRVWLNEGAAVFSNSGLSLGNSISWAVSLGDLDGDGDLDAFIANEDQAPGIPGANTVWLNQLPPITTEVTLSAGGDLVITDINGGDSNDTLTLSSDGADLIIADPNHLIGLNGVTGLGHGTNEVIISRGLPGWTGGIIFDTLDGDDTLTLDFGGGAMEFGAPVTFLGGGQNSVPNGDTLVLTDSAAVPTHFATAIFNYIDAHSGDIDIDGQVIVYDGLEPITSTLSVADVALNYSAASEIITIGPAVAPGQTVVTSTAGEITTFTNPTNELRVDAGDGDDFVAVGGLGSGWSVADLTLLGGTGADEVLITGATDLGTGDFRVQGETEIVTINADLFTSGGGVIQADALRSIAVNPGARVSVVDGNLNLIANKLNLGTGAFTGVTVDGAILETTGSGGIVLEGRGGNQPTADDQVGVHLLEDAVIRSTASGPAAGTITLVGTGGTGNQRGRGVVLSSANEPLVSSVDGDILIIGQGGDSLKTDNDGIYVNGGTIESTGVGADAATITLMGTGGAGGVSNRGIVLQGKGATVTSARGRIDITAEGGAGTLNNSGFLTLDQAEVRANGDAVLTISATGHGDNAHGAFLNALSKWQVDAQRMTVDVTGGTGSTSTGLTVDGAQLVTNSGNIEIFASAASTGEGLLLAGAGAEIGGNTATGGVYIVADRIQLDGGEIDSDGHLLIYTRTPFIPVSLGSGIGTLNLDDSELARLADGFASITIGGSHVGEILLDTATFRDPLMLITGRKIHDATTGTDLDMIGGDIAVFDGTIAPGLSPGILEVAGHFAFADTSTFEVEYQGVTPGTGGAGFHDQLRVLGGDVAIGAGVILDHHLLAPFDPIALDGTESFVLIDVVDPAGSVTGTFDSLPEGTILTDFLGSGLDYAMTYTGGLDGNDVVLNYHPREVDLVVDKTADVVAVTEGSTLTYSVTVANHGPEDVTGAIIEDRFSARLRDVELTAIAPSDPAATSTASLSLVAGNIFNETVDLAAGTSITFTFTGTVTGPLDPEDAAEAIVTNVAEVTVPRGYLDTDDSNNRAHDSDIVVFQATGGSGVFVDSGQELGTTGSQDVVLGDVDNDGDLDAFVGKWDEGHRIWLNNGLGVFTDSGQVLASPGSLGVALGDLDGDGDLDAFIANHGLSSVPPSPDQVWFNDGSGVFTDSGQALGSSRNRDVSLGDVDGDGDLDAFVVSRADANTVWLNDGSGLFVDSGQVIEVFSSRSHGVALGDVDADGDLDAFVTNDNAADLLYLNDGSGIFTDSSQVLGLSGAGRDVNLGDLDGDGDLDAFVVNTYGDANKVWLNNGSGAFSDSGQSLGTNWSNDIGLGDFDDDGDLDAFVVNSPFTESAIWTNDGSGAFGQTQTLILFNQRAVAVAVGDLDGDGDLDAFVANSDGRSDRVWLNQNAPPETTTISLIGGDLVITDTLGGDTDDDWTITSDGANLTIVDNNGNGIDLGPVTGSGQGTDTVVISLGEWSGGLIVNSLAGDDTISIGDLIGLPGSVTVNSGADFDHVELTGTSTLALNASASFTGEKIFGTGISLNTSGTGTISLTGIGSDSTAWHNGVTLISSTLTSADGAITINGEGGDGTIFNDGVQLKTSTVTTTGGSITVAGTGGGTGIRNKGVVTVGSTFTAGGAGNLSIDGSGGTGKFQNEGVSLSAATALSVVDGEMTITGTGGDGNFGGVGANIKETTFTSNGAGSIWITGSSMAGGIINGGVEIKAATITTTGTGVGDGNVTITGTGSSNGTLLNDGVKLTDTDIIAGVNASIDIGGTSTGTTVLNTGVVLKSDTNLTVAGTGSIFIDGRGSANGTVINDGVFLGAGTDLNFEDGFLSIFGVGGTASQGVQTVGATITGTGSGNVEIFGQSLGTGGINQGIALDNSTISTVAGSGSIMMFGQGSHFGTFSNDGIFLSNSHLATGSNGSIELFGDGGGSDLGTGFFNSGVTLKKGSTLAANGSGTVRVEGYSGDAKLLNRGVWIDGAGSLVSSGSGDITIIGDSHGSTLFNQGVFLNFADVITDGNILIQGTGSQTSTSVFNTGVSIIGSPSDEIISFGGNVTISGVGGKGSTLNEGVRVIGMQFGGTLNMTGTSHPNTTAGVLNTGVYMLNTNLGGATAASTITGFGGGLGTSAGNLNHGIYMQGIVGNVYAGATAGTKGFGALSKDETGNFF